MSNGQDIENMDMFRQELLFSGLNEICNIGTGNAINELSQIMEVPVDQLVPETTIISFKDLHEAVANPEIEMICGIAEVDGDVDGMILVLFQVDEFSKFISRYKFTKGYQNNKENIEDLDDLELFSTVVDKLCIKYVEAIQGFLNVSLERYEINVCREAVLNILSIPAMKFVGTDDNLSMTHATFSFYVDDVIEIQGHMVYIPGTGAIKKVIEKLMVI